MNIRSKKLSALLLAAALTISSIPGIGILPPRITAEAAEEGTADGNSSGEATAKPDVTTVTDGRIALGEEEITAKVKHDENQTAFEVWEGGKKVGSVNYKTAAVTVNDLTQGAKSTKYVAGVVNKRDDLKSVSATTKTASAAYATAKWSKNALNITAKSPGECYAWVLTYDGKDKKKTILDFAFTRVVVHAAPTTIALNTGQTTVSVNNSAEFSIKPMRKTKNMSEAALVSGDAIQAKVTVKPADGIEILDADSQKVSDGIIDIDGGSKFYVHVTSFAKKKAAKVTVTAACIQNGKKASSKLTVSNGVKNMTFKQDTSTHGSQNAAPYVDTDHQMDVQTASGDATEVGMVCVTMPNCDFWALTL